MIISKQIFFLFISLIPSFAAETPIFIGLYKTYNDQVLHRGVNSH